MDSRPFRKYSHVHTSIHPHKLCLPILKAMNSHGYVQHPFLYLKVLSQTMRHLDPIILNIFAYLINSPVCNQYWHIWYLCMKRGIFIPLLNKFTPCQKYVFLRERLDSGPHSPLSWLPLCTELHSKPAALLLVSESVLLTAHNSSFSIIKIYV